VGWLQAWDPVARKVVWETPKAPRATSGALATAGNLVFMGNSRGQILSAYNAKTGAKLWEFPTQGDVYAGPISYELDGVQYIAASVGGAGQGDYFAPGYGRILVFKVGGTTVLPPKAPYTPRQLNPPPVTASAEAVARGTRLYADHCSVCHGANAAPGGGRGGNSAPDLGTSPFIQAQAAFDTVVLQGQRVDKGMPTFSDKLKAAGIEVTLWTREQYEARKKAEEERLRKEQEAKRKQGGGEPMQELGELLVEGLGKIFGGMFGGFDDLSDTSVVMTIKDPGGKLLDIEFEDAAGKKLRTGRSSSFGGQDGQTRVFDLDEKLSDTARVKFAVLTPAAVTKAPRSWMPLALPVPYGPCARGIAASFTRASSLRVTSPSASASAAAIGSNRTFASSDWRSS
jgi:mono/diheme cytochrome c family protein